MKMHRKNDMRANRLTITQGRSDTTQQWIIVECDSNINTAFVRLRKSGMGTNVRRMQDRDAQSKWFLNCSYQNNLIRFPHIQYYKYSQMILVCYHNWHFDHKVLGNIH